MNFFEKNKKSGINLQVHYIPVHIQPFYEENFGFRIGDFPIAEKFYRDEISLPIYPNLEKQEVKYIIRKINELLSQCKTI